MSQNTTYIEEPTTCPACDYTLIKVNDQLFCKNTACPAQLNKKLEHFCKTLGIKGLGPRTIERLQIQELSEIFYMDFDEMVSVLGEKTAIKLQQEIEKAKSASLQTVLASLSIPLIGETAAGKLCSVIDDINSISLETCKEAGLGDKATENLLNWLEYEGKDLIPFLPFSFKTTSKNNSQNLKTVCITGKLKSFKTKADAKDILEKAGYRLVDSVTKTTNYLVDESNSTSSKRATAEKYGIPIITDLKDLIENHHE